MPINDRDVNDAAWIVVHCALDIDGDHRADLTAADHRIDAADVDRLVRHARTLVAIHDLAVRLGVRHPDERWPDIPGRPIRTVVTNWRCDVRNLAGEQCDLQLGHTGRHSRGGGYIPWW